MPGRTDPRHPPGTPAANAPVPDGDSDAHDEHRRVPGRHNGPTFAPEGSRPVRRTEGSSPMHLSRISHRTRLGGLLALAVAASLGAGLSSLAVFTSESTVSANSFSSGTVVITTDHPATAVVSFANMAPGDKGEQTLVVTNGGSLDMRYALSTVATNTDTKALKDQLDLTITPGACLAPSGAAAFTGKLGAAAFGTVAQGGGAGERTVAAGATDQLCFGWSLPLVTGNAFQGSATTAVFTLDAEQTKNNP